MSEAIVLRDLATGRYIDIDVDRAAAIDIGDRFIGALGDGISTDGFLHELGVALFLSGIRAEGVESRRLGSPAAAATWVGNAR